MKKKTYIVLLILLFSSIPIFSVSVKASTSLFSPNVIKSELLVSFDDSGDQNTESAGIIPFWVDLVDAETVSNDGEGVYIAVLDTGLVDSWEDYFPQANIATEYGKGFTHKVVWNKELGDFELDEKLIDKRGFITHPWGSGHGTHVTSTIVGFQLGDSWIRGVAPKATIIPVLVLDYWTARRKDKSIWMDGGGTDAMVAAGINYIADLSEDLDGPVIISMSLGGPTPAPEIEEAIDYAISKGVIVVVSAGNSGYEGMGWPGAYSQVISCGMAGWTEQFTYSGWWTGDVPEKLNSKDSWGNNHQLFLDYISSRPNKDLGQKTTDLDVTTPGAAIVGPYQGAFYSAPLNYYYLWGTSMAAPHVSGIASLVLQNHVDTDQSTMEKILKNAASGEPFPCDGALSWDYPPYLWYFEWYGTDYGSGFLQADAALKSAG